MKKEREHYYYVLKDYGLRIVKAFNKKQMRQQQGVKDADIIARFRHYTEAYTYAHKYYQSNGYSSRPYYESLTGSDFID